ncbi:protease complex subunit PrcB family protein [Brevibacillus sp. H7]|uniref:protease complex subunit PrcB family protein n=1 Tax=Brevibacillus sp. H7 TaxID=3349138 RepID=UPI0038201DF5
MLKIGFGILTAISLILTGPFLSIDNPTSFPAANESQAAVESASSSYPPAVQDALKKLRKNGGQTVVHAGGKTYVVIGVGQRPTGGYRLTVDQVKQKAPNSFEVYVREHKPSPGTLTTQVISYPTLVVSLPQANASVHVTIER